MKTLILKEAPKITTGFVVPENYFEDFSAKMMQQLPVEKSKVISIFRQKKTWFTAVAAIFVIGICIPIFTKSNDAFSEIDDATLENYLAFQSTDAQSDVLSSIENQDFQYTIDENTIDDALIENELSNNQNLELYLLN